MPSHRPTPSVHAGRSPHALVVMGLLAVALGGCQGLLDADPPGVPVSSFSFVERSEDLGLPFTGPSYGAGWGDIDGDGDPDLWAGNHAEVPNLYINRGDGTFVDGGGTWLDADFITEYDAHGIAWIDFDNDGDQDMFESVGSQRGTGIGRNRVHVNQGGRLAEDESSRGLAHRRASGRCPIPYDHDGDGRLDVVMIAQPREDATQPTALFTQTGDGTFELTHEVPPEEIHPIALCGQLSDVDGDDVMEVVRFGRPAHLSAHDGRSAGFEDVSEALGMPQAPLKPFDVVLADLDNDLDMDMYVTRWLEHSEFQHREADQQIRMALRLQGASSGARFRTEGEVTISLGPAGFWRAEEIFLGEDCTSPEVVGDEILFTVSRDEALGLCPFEGGVDEGLYLGVDETGLWHVDLTTQPFNRGNVVIDGAAPLTDVQGIDIDGLTPDEESTYNRDRLYFRDGDVYNDRGWNAGIQDPNTCTSVAAADFDNDADLDLYLVCATAVENLPNILLLNEGGTFMPMVDHGAEGATVGRGDSVAVADYDQDGWLDLFVTNGYRGWPYNEGPQQLFHNEGSGNHWLQIDLVGTESNRDAIGSTVYVTTGQLTQVREAHAGTHHMAQHHRRLHFGLASYDAVDRIEVVWPTGERQVVEDVEVDQILEIVEE